MNQLENNDNNRVRLWKIGTVCNQLSDAYAKFNSPPERLPVNEIMLFR
jgi:hypothetical protein